MNKKYRIQIIIRIPPRVIIHRASARQQHLQNEVERNSVRFGAVILYMFEKQNTQLIGSKITDIDANISLISVD
jgi:hypothetical protein